MPYTFEIKRVRLNAGGYTASGAYYGAGAPLFYFESLCGSHFDWIRGSNRWAVRRVLRNRYPNCGFLPARAA